MGVTLTGGPGLAMPWAWTCFRSKIVGLTPTWTLIQQCLHRLQQAPCVKCLVDVPFWVANAWWPQLVKLQVRGSPVVWFHPGGGAIHQLPGRRNDSYQVEISLFNVIRGLLEGKQISSESFQAYITKFAFFTQVWQCIKCWPLLKSFHWTSHISLQTKWVALLLEMYQFNASQAKHAYSAMLLVTGFASLIFCPFLTTVKNECNSHQAKYASFWDAERVLQKLAELPVDFFIHQRCQ